LSPFPLPLGLLASIFSLDSVFRLKHSDLGFDCRFYVRCFPFDALLWLLALVDSPVRMVVLRSPRFPPSGGSGHILCLPPALQVLGVSTAPAEVPQSDMRPSLSLPARRTVLFFLRRLCNGFDVTLARFHLDTRHSLEGLSRLPHSLRLEGIAKASAPLKLREALAATQLVVGMGSLPHHSQAGVASGRTDAFCICLYTTP